MITGACAKGLYTAGSLPGYDYYYCYRALSTYLFYFMTRLAFPPSLSAQVRVDREGSCLPTNPPAMMQAGRQAGSSQQQQPAASTSTSTSSQQRGKVFNIFYTPDMRRMKFFLRSMH